MAPLRDALSRRLFFF